MSKSSIHRGDWPRLKRGLRGRLFGRPRAWLLLRFLEFCIRWGQWLERKRDDRGQGLRPRICSRKTVRAIAQGGCIASSKPVPAYDDDCPVMREWREWKCN